MSSTAIAASSPASNVAYTFNTDSPTARTSTPTASNPADTTAAGTTPGTTLTALIKELTNSQVISATSTASGAPSDLSTSALSNLNAAFSQLLANSGGSDSASLQSFLSSFLQNLQSGAGGSIGSLGNSVDVNA